MEPMYAMLPMLDPVKAENATPGSASVPTRRIVEDGVVMYVPEDEVLHG